MKRKHSVLFEESRICHLLHLVHLIYPIPSHLDLGRPSRPSHMPSCRPKWGYRYGCSHLLQAVPALNKDVLIRLGLRLFTSILFGLGPTARLCRRIESEPQTPKLEQHQDRFSGLSRDTWVCFSSILDGIEVFLQSVDYAGTFPADTYIADVFADASAAMRVNEGLFVAIQTVLAR